MQASESKREATEQSEASKCDFNSGAGFATEDSRNEV